MSAEILARWQFGITTVYHFFFVPVTISLSMIVAIFQTKWYRSGDERWLRITKFFGKLFLINFAMGVVTGIVQEFQFGMNWSEYSRFVGDIFGAPLALEALVAFFLESTFLGLWIFGWDRLSKKAHLTAIWLNAIGTLLSSIFILAANSWMQNPVGATFNPATGRAELSNFGALFTNPIFLTTFPHTIASAWMSGCGFVLGVAGYWYVKEHRRGDAADKDTVSGFRSAVKFAAIGLIISGILVSISGDLQGKVIAQIQPMKIAAAENLEETAGGNGTGAPFKPVAIFDMKDGHEIWSFEIPNLLSFLSTNDLHARIRGINDLNEEYTKVFNDPSQIPSEYKELQKAYLTTGDAMEQTKGRTKWQPNVPVSFWGFRIMIAAGLLSMLIGAVVLLMMRKGRVPKGGKLWTSMMWLAPLLPLLGISVGWIFTEMGRQPWLVYNVLPTLSGYSPSVSATEVLISMIVFTLLYGAGAVIEVGLMLHYIKAGLPAAHPVELHEDEDAPLSFSY
ncbi:MAG: cytochrome ubiquinol oxidase subunit I [Propionibacteriaceae bacterium]